MAYKITKEPSFYNGVVRDKFGIMVERKRLFSKKTKWVYLREFTYASYDTWNGERVYRDTLKEAEDYVKLLLNISDHNLLDKVDVGVYESRDIKLNRILNDN
jgi:hypothetical protein